MTVVVTTPPVIDELNCDMPFNPTRTLIKPFEVKCYAPSSAHSYVDSLCAFIGIKEEKLFNRCFGYEFYLCLLEDCIEYTCVPSEESDTVILYCHYQEGTVYQVGKHVLYQGEIYIVVQQTTGVENPCRCEYFKKAKKFKQEHNNFLWDRYLKKLLAFSITHTSVMYRLIQDTAKGLVKKFESGLSEPATLKEMQALKDEYLGDIEDIIYNMECFILRYPQCFPKYKKFQDKCKKGGCAPKKRHYGFNTNRLR